MADNPCNLTFTDPEEAAEHALWSHHGGISDEFINDLPGPGRHFVYRLEAGLPGRCSYVELATVYIGVTSNLRARMRSHSKKWWWPTILHDAAEFAEYPTREIAEYNERRGIHFGNPDLNVSLGVGRKLSSLVVER